MANDRNFISGGDLYNHLAYSLHIRRTASPRCPVVAFGGHCTLAYFWFCIRAKNKKFVSGLNLCMQPLDGFASYWRRSFPGVSHCAFGVTVLWPTFDSVLWLKMEISFPGDISATAWQICFIFDTQLPWDVQLCLLLSLYFGLLLVRYYV